MLADDAAKRTSVFYVGPKKQSLLWDLGMKDVMEFGMWRWLCYPLVWVLNFFNNMIPNYGVAIILLTILVRLLFWPLTHKSTVGMKKMQELQPKMKEIQAKFKDNPQRMQQETWALYKEYKVNPMSSCLPMLIQIPSSSRSSTCFAPQSSFATRRSSGLAISPSRKRSSRAGSHSAVSTSFRS